MVFPYQDFINGNHHCPDILDITEKLSVGWDTGIRSLDFTAGDTLAIQGHARPGEDQCLMPRYLLAGVAFPGILPPVAIYAQA